MKKFNKIFSAVLCAALAAGALSGCGNVNKDKYVAKKRSESESSQAAEAGNDSSQVDAESSQEEIITSEGSWNSMKFTLDGEELVLDRLDYSVLTNSGWNFDPSIYGLSDLSANKGEYYQRSIFLNNDKYDEATCAVGLTNFNDEPCGIDEMQIWSIEFIAKDKTSYPEVTLDGGITWGSDSAAVEAAYGTPSKSTRNDAEGYTELLYTDNAANSVTLYVYDDGGVQRMIVESSD